MGCGVVIRENGELVAVDLGLSDCELAKCFRKSEIPKNYRFEDTVSQHTAGVEFWNNRNGDKVGES